MTHLLLAAAFAAPSSAAVLVRRAAPSPRQAFAPLPSLAAPAMLLPAPMAAPSVAPLPSLVSAAPHAPAPLAAAPRARRRDVSAEYRSSFEADGDLGESQMRELRGLRVLFLGGYLSNQVDLHRRFDPLDLAGFGDYFDQTMGWLRARGVSVERVPLQTESTPEENSVRIAAALRASDKPVIVFSHSKGGLDMLETLRAHPELRPKVRGWAPQQAPFRGSPVADLVHENALLRRLSAWVLEKLGGSVDSLLSLTTGERAAYMRRHAAELRRIAEQVPIITFASYIPRQALHRDTLFRLLRDRMERKGLKNDGLVPVKSTFLAGAERVVIPGLDHLLPMSRSMRQSFDQVLHSRTLLGMLLRRGRTGAGAGQGASIAPRRKSAIMPSQSPPPRS